MDPYNPNQPNSNQDQPADQPTGWESVAAMADGTQPEVQPAPEQASEAIEQPGQFEPTPAESITAAFFDDPNRVSYKTTEKDEYEKRLEILEFANPSAYEIVSVANNIFDSLADKVPEARPVYDRIQTEVKNGRYAFAETDKNGDINPNSLDRSKFRLATPIDEESLLNELGFNEVNATPYPSHGYRLKVGGENGLYYSESKRNQIRDFFNNPDHRSLEHDYFAITELMEDLIPDSTEAKILVAKMHDDFLHNDTQPYEGLSKIYYEGLKERQEKYQYEETYKAERAAVDPKLLEDLEGYTKHRTFFDEIGGEAAKTFHLAQNQLREQIRQKIHDGEYRESYHVFAGMAGHDHYVFGRNEALRARAEERDYWRNLQLMGVLLGDKILKSEYEGLSDPAKVLIDQTLGQVEEISYLMPSAAATEVERFNDQVRNNISQGNYNQADIALTDSGLPTIFAKNESLHKQIEVNKARLKLERTDDWFEGDYAKLPSNEQLSEGVFDYLENLQKRVLVAGLYDLEARELVRDIRYSMATGDFNFAFIDDKGKFNPGKVYLSPEDENTTSSTGGDDAGEGESSATIEESTGFTDF